MKKIWFWPLIVLSGALLFSGLQGQSGFAQSYGQNRPQNGRQNPDRNRPQPGRPDNRPDDIYNGSPLEEQNRSFTESTTSTTVCSSYVDGVLLPLHTAEEIRDRFETLEYLDVSTMSFSGEASLKKPYDEGELSGDCLESALEQVNFCRYLAGCCDVILTDDANTKAQRGALVMAVNGVLSHSPSKPSGMSDDMYEDATWGACACIAMGYSTLASAVVDGWMMDDDDSNLDSVGHRNWILSPFLREIGLGFVDYYEAYYPATSDYGDYSYGELNTGGAMVALCYPAPGDFPVEYFGQVSEKNTWANTDNVPWTIELDNTYFTSPEMDETSVKLTRLSDGKEFTYDEDDNNLSLSDNRYFTTYGNAVIFVPGDKAEIIEDDESYKVEVFGLKDASGKPVDFEYTVDFFSLTDGEPWDF